MEVKSVTNPMSVGGVLISLRLRLDKPLKSVTHGQCDTRPMVTSPARASRRLDRYRIILLGDRGTRV